MASSTNLYVTGMGICASTGIGKHEFFQALKEETHAFGFLERPGRQAPRAQTTRSSGFIGAEIQKPLPLSFASSNLLRTASYSSKVALCTLKEAWDEADLDELDSRRIGLVVGGSNLQQRSLLEAHQRYEGRVSFLRPSYGFSHMDSDICGICSDHFGIGGFAYTLGAASASGQVALIQGVQSLLTHQVDACIVLGALSDLSYWELQGFRSMGAMGSDRFAHEPAEAPRPFDHARDGFIYGESCGAVVIERQARGSSKKNYGRLSGWGMSLDGNRNPNPSLEGEVFAIQQALNSSGLSYDSIDYINPHGSGSKIGDETELLALKKLSLEGAPLNGTKSLIGHGLSSAGCVELIATLLQMEHGQLHGTRNLQDPIDRDFNWIPRGGIEKELSHALTLSMGFGGINSALVISKEH